MRAILITLLVGAMVIAAETPADAHCDTYDGPVVKAGEKSLDTGELDFALIWVKPAVEAELRAAFKQAISVRKLGAEARELADRYFLETLVRLHRAGEGEPFTGIKPKGTDLGPVIPLADAAIRSGSSRALAKVLTEATNEGLHHRFSRVLAKRKFKPHDVAAGREYVDAYVLFTHYVEGLYNTAASAAHGHGHSAAKPEPEHH